MSGLSLRLSLAAKLDRLESIMRRVGERIGWPQAWLQEFILYLGDPRMTLEEFYVRFTLKRIAAEPKFAAIKTEADALAFYRDEDYMLWRNLVHRRHSTWRRVLVTMRGRVGGLVEIGCGIAPISTWVSKLKPSWWCMLHDIGIPYPPHFKYALWRMERHHPNYWRRDVQAMGCAQVVCLIDVLEHTADPLGMAKEWVEFLAPGGYLHWNFVGHPHRNELNLATDEQREETVAYLLRALHLVWESDGYHVSRKHRGG